MSENVGYKNGTPCFYDAGLVLDAQLDASAEKYSGWVDNLGWAKNIKLWVSTDKQYDLVYQLRNQALKASADVSIAATQAAKVLRVAQVETATVVGTVTGNGDASIVVTAAGMTNTPKTILVPVSAGVAQVETLLTYGAITTSGNATVTVTATGMGNTPKAVSVALVTAVKQVETATVAGTITTAGNASVVITAAGMTGSPKTKTVAVALNDDASAIAGKIRTALGLDADIIAKFVVSGATDKVILTARDFAANDATLNIALADGTCVGVTTAASSANTTAGSVADTNTTIATKVRTALTADADVGAFFTIGGTDNEVLLTRKAAAANDATMNVAIADNTCAGILADTTSMNMTAGVAADNASAVATKIRTALKADVDVTTAFTVSGATDKVILTSLLYPGTNDTTLNISVDNGTCTGLTTAASSANTTSGVAETFGYHAIALPVGYSIRFGLINSSAQNNTVSKVYALFTD